VLSAISTSEVDRFATLQRSSGSRRLPSLRLGRRSGSQEQAKYDKRIRFAEKLPELREAMAEHLDKGELDRERVSAIALRLINLGWFRVGSDRYVRGSGTYGITTLMRRHVTVRGHQPASVVAYSAGTGAA
jgi:DNA topoisomerase-1